MLQATNFISVFIDSFSLKLILLDEGYKIFDPSVDNLRGVE